MTYLDNLAHNPGTAHSEEPPGEWNMLDGPNELS